ncbi:MAG: hypothetical protein RL662_159 [Bacteroidota bacterium]|jgi:hypothetical protein
MRKILSIIFLFGNIILFYAQTDDLTTKLDSIEKTYILKEVVISSQKEIFQQKPDRLVFNIENTIMSTSSDAIEALRITPGIVVQNDQISMTAKSSLSVMIDDRPVAMEGVALIAYLKSIAASNIQSIEIITNPPAKYRAEGNSGIINIILKKNRNDSWYLSLRGRYTQEKYSDQNIGGDFNYKKNKIELYSNISAANGSYKKVFEKTTYYNTEIWQLDAPRKNTYRYINGSISLDYTVNSKFKLGGNYFVHRTGNPFTVDEMDTKVYNFDNIMNKYMEASSGWRYNGLTHAANFHNIFSIDTLGKKITIDFDYLTFTRKDDKENYSRIYLPDGSEIEGSYFAKSDNNKGKVTSYTTKVDVEYPLKWIRLNFGGQLDFTSNHNDYKFYDNTSGKPIQDEDQTNFFKYNEDIQSLYFSTNKKFGSKLSVQLGLRVENTLTKGHSETIKQTDKNNYLDFFPTFYLMYWLTDNKSVSFNYGRRINRPYFFFLNPFKTYFNEFDYSEGNPFLRPSYSNNLELTLSTNNTFVHRIWHSYFSDDYASFPFINPENKVVRHFPVNFINYYSLGFSESYTFNKLWWWSSYNNLSIYYIRKNSTLPEAKQFIDKVSGNFRTHNDFTLSKKRLLVFNLGYYYELPYLEGFSEAESYHNLYAGVGINLLDNKLSITLTANNLFVSKWRELTTNSNGVQYVEKSRWEPPYSFQLSFKYTLGNQFIGERNKRSSNQGVKGRL